MSISIFELFKIGIGPSSSHTVGPMKAAKMYLHYLKEEGFFNKIGSIQIELYGSLALTGIGHGTDKALILGLLGEDCETVDTQSVDSIIAGIKKSNELILLGKKKVPFTQDDIKFLKDKRLPYHSNAMRFLALDKQNEVIDKKIYYSVGGGFVVDHDTASKDKLTSQEVVVPYVYRSWKELETHCITHKMSVFELIMENEKIWRSEKGVKEGALHIWHVMQECVRIGCENEGVLPGGLKVQRRAKKLLQELEKQKKSENRDPAEIMDWVSLWALATNEENAAGGRVVTAPTNGGAGVMPAVLHYYVNMCEGATQEGIITFLLVSGAIGILYKEGASISAAEMGCQGEVGVACSMAAAGLTAALGGSLSQIENAAEIGMEHNLGLTCDPVGGLVQIPCIERNTMGAVKAINASRLAIRGDGTYHVSLDQVIATMLQTGTDMMNIYKETSQGGLAVNVPEC